jgi:hypothetical protein
MQFQRSDQYWDSALLRECLLICFYPGITLVSDDLERSKHVPHRTMD